MGFENEERNRKLISCDQEVWVTERIRTAIHMANAVMAEKNVAAEHDMVERAIDSIIEGAAVEIVRTVGMDVPFINIREPIHHNTIKKAKIKTR